MGKEEELAIRRQAGAPVSGRRTTGPDWFGGPRRLDAGNLNPNPSDPTARDPNTRVAQYRRRMSDEQSGPSLEPTLSEWIKARAETERHLKAGGAPSIDAEWAQQLADLLATERSWQDQYTDLIALGSTGGRFPPSNR